MANNNILQNAAYSGALSGLTSRWVELQTPSAPSSNQAVLASLAFGVMVDSFIPVGSYDSTAAELLYSLCQGVWSDRMPLSDVPSTYSEVAETVATLFLNSASGLEPVTSGAIVNYTVGPSWTGAKFSTIQAAINAANTDGHGTIYGGAVILVYPASYGEAVIIPDTLRYWHLKALSSGGSPGPFTTSLTINVGNQDVDWTVEGFGISTVIVNQPVAGVGTWYNNFVNCWFFGAVSVTGANLRTLFQDSHWYGGAGTLTVNNLDTRVYGCEFLVSNAIHSITATEIYFANNTLNSGRLSIAGTNARILENTFRSYAAPNAIADAMTGLSYCYGNTFGGVAGTVYSKTGASVLREGGNTFVGGTFPFFSIAAGSIISATVAGIRSVSGSLALVAADIAGVTRTTILKTDGGDTISLPLPSTVPVATQISVKDRNGNALADPIFVDVTGGSTIDGVSSVFIASNYGAINFQCDGANWFEIARKGT